jgi:hypothetical protein
VIVGWVELPCETHQPQVLMVMGFAKSSTHPTDPLPLSCPRAPDGDAIKTEGRRLTVGHRAKTLLLELP